MRKLTNDIALILAVTASTFASSGQLGAEEALTRSRISEEAVHSKWRTLGIHTFRSMMLSGSALTTQDIKSLLSSGRKVLVCDALVWSLEMPRNERSAEVVLNPINGDAIGFRTRWKIVVPYDQAKALPPPKTRLKDCLIVAIGHTEGGTNAEYGGRIMISGTSDGHQYKFLEPSIQKLGP